MPTDPKAEHADTELDETKKGGAEDGDSDFEDALSAVETRRKAASDRSREEAPKNDKKGEETARRAFAKFEDKLEDLEEVAPKSAKAIRDYINSVVEGLGDRDKELDGLKGLKGIEAFKDLMPRVAALTNDSETKQAREAHRALDAIASKGLAKQFGANRSERMGDDTIRNRCIEFLREVKDLQSELEDQGKDLSLKEVAEKLAAKRYKGKMTESKADQFKRAAASSDIRPGRTGDGKFVAKGSKAGRLAIVENFVKKQKSGG